jgi:hypothetical protein
MDDKETALPICVSCFPVDLFRVHSKRDDCVGNCDRLDLGRLDLWWFGRHVIDIIAME